MQTPGEELVDTLEKLRQRLNGSGSERTVGLKDAMGDDCVYYKRSLDKFVREDYVEIRDIIREATKTLDIIEGGSQ